MKKHVLLGSSSHQSLKVCCTDRMPGVSMDVQASSRMSNGMEAPDISFHAINDAS